MSHVSHLLWQNHMVNMGTESLLGLTGIVEWVCERAKSQASKAHFSGQTNQTKYFHPTGPGRSVTKVSGSVHIQESEV